MRRIVLILAVVAAAVGAPLAPAQPGGQPPDVSIQVRPTPIVFGQSTTVSGRVRRDDRAGKRVDLQARPYGASSFTTIASGTLQQNGRYSFGVKPDRNTRYRVSAQTSPPVTSTEAEANVAFRVTLRLSDSTPRRCSRVRFSGSVFPAHDGRTVYLQRLIAPNRWRRVARTTLRDAGTARSRYSRRVRVCRDGTFRARVVRDADHVTGDSAQRAIDVR